MLFSDFDEDLYNLFVLEESETASSRPDIALSFSLTRSPYRPRATYQGPQHTLDIRHDYTIITLHSVEPD